MYKLQALNPQKTTDETRDSYIQGVETCGSCTYQAHKYSISQVPLEVERNKPTYWLADKYKCNLKTVLTVSASFGLWS